MGSESDSESSEQSTRGLATEVELFMSVTGMTESEAIEEMENNEFTKKNLKGKERRGEKMKRLKTDAEGEES